MPQLVDDLVGHADDVEVHDAAPRRARDDVDDSGEERVVRVAGDDHTADGDSVGIVGLIEERPHEAGRVELMHVGGQRDPYGHVRPRRYAAGAKSRTRTWA